MKFLSEHRPNNVCALTYDEFEKLAKFVKDIDRTYCGLERTIDSFLDSPTLKKAKQEIESTYITLTQISTQDSFRPNTYFITYADDVKFLKEFFSYI